VRGQGPNRATPRPRPCDAKAPAARCQGPGRLATVSPVPVERRPSRTTLAVFGALAATLVVVLAGCGKAAHSPQSAAGGVETVLVRTGAAGTPATATRNTTRLGGSNPVADAAAVARAAYPGPTAKTRPQAVVLVDAGDWPAALAASSLASSPLGAPLLYEEGARLPQLSEQALHALSPTGAKSLGGAQLILLGPSVQAPAGYRAQGTGATGAYALAASVAKLLAIVHGSAPHQAIVANAAGPPALAMPAAGLAAQSGAPILFVTSGGVPPATAAELRSLGRPAIYAVGSTAIGTRTLNELARYGPVKRAEVSPNEDATPAGNAIAAARFSDGSFGWGIREAGHGLAFANADRPLDAPAAAILSATGDYAPLLLLEDATGVPSPLSHYLSDIQPAAPHSEPVKGVYNHGWLIGDESAISATTQAELDAMLQIVPVSTPSSESSSLPVE